MATDRRHAPLILIVDDHPDNVEVLKVRLDALGYRTATAGDGETALKMVAANPPDLILLDVMMPRMDGNEVAKRIKADKSLPFIPIIMQTALDTTQGKVTGLDAGADDYVTKPINYDELQARMNSSLRLKKAQDQLAAKNVELAEMAITDSLTGIFNRRHLDVLLDEMFEHSLRLHEYLALAMFDIDHFKRVNDNFGHQAGDAVLGQFSRLLKHLVRDIDRVGRYGGEEFVVLLPGTSLDAGVTFAERVRQEVETHRFEYDGGALTCTVSVGVAAWHHPRIQTRQQLVKSADDSLYIAKSLGRNKVIRFDGPEFNANVKDVDDQYANGTTGGGATRPG
ncbi:MAG TPA: diguanylate cyclase [Gemmatimonadaceae bacterium]|jgi:diguanylate cyclase (GGDEF)-like protein|nr:diguanylate cyclase [Gemmatimonadaceae bacterium]